MSEVSNSLMKCPACGMDVSKRADVCVHCGDPLTLQTDVEHSLPQEPKPADITRPISSNPVASLQEPTSPDVIDSPAVSRILFLKGPVSRKEWWLALGASLAIILIVFSLPLIGPLSSYAFASMLEILLLLFSVWIFWTACLGRLKDLGASPFLALLFLIPVAGLVLFLWLGISPTCNVFVDKDSKEPAALNVGE